ncbi:MAG: DNRLRE domain-containing protein, partial [Candidatus Fermentibacteraceae bacterium]|nr:DNRLRE domain-containing protein [Candidatus Fermentibacteraceae bacterium]
TMELFCEAMYGTKTGNPVYYMINESWDELTVTFNTQPGYDTATPLTAAWPEAGTWHQVDVTGFVEEWVGGTHVDFGIYCFCEDTEGTCVPGFWSSDYQEQSLRPRLVVEYFPEGFDQCTWADIKEDQ